MTKARRMMQENIALIDLLIELTDARAPQSGRNPDIDTLAKGKSRIVVLNKADLADSAQTKNWRAHFEKQGFRFSKRIRSPEAEAFDRSGRS